MGSKVLTGFKRFLKVSFKSSHQNKKGNNPDFSTLDELINKQLTKHKTQNLPDCVMEIMLQWRNLPSPFQEVLYASQSPSPAKPQNALQSGYRGHRANCQHDPSKLWDGGVGDKGTFLYPPRFFWLF